MGANHGVLKKVFEGGVLALVIFLPWAGNAASININTPPKTWRGSGGDKLWSTSANWDLGAPVNGDTLNFNGTSGRTNNDFSNITLSKISIDANASPFFLEGNAVTFSDLKNIENNALSTQTISFSGLVGLEHISAKAGTLIINSTITSAGSTLDVTGPGKVVFNNPLVGLSLFHIYSTDEVTLNTSVSTTVFLNHATALINSTTQLPGVEIAESGILKIASDVSMAGPIDLLEAISTNSTPGAIDTNGFTFELSGKLRDGGNETPVVPARFMKMGQGTLILFGDNAVDGWSGETRIVGGTLRAGSATAFRSSTFTLADTAGVVLDFNGNNFTLSELNGGGDVGGTVLLSTGHLTIDGETSSRFGGKIMGEGGVTKNGGGTLWLTGANAYTGTTTVNAGTLKGDGRGLQGHIINNASVVFDQTGSGTFAGEISGGGTVQKTGAGTLTAAHANSFSGGTTITDGILAVGDSGALGSGNVTVTSGVLQGDGTPRTIGVGDNYTQTGGTLALTLYGAGVDQLDRLNVAHAASLGGNLSIRVHPGFLPIGTSTVVIVNAASRNGTFDFSSSGAALRFELAYTSSSAILTSIQTPYATFGQSSNQTTVAHYLDGLYPTATGDLALVLGELNALPAEDLSKALKSISPQPYQTMTTMGMATLTSFSQTIHSQLARSRAGHTGIQTMGFEQSKTNSRWGSLTADAGVRDDGLLDDPFYVPGKRWGAFLTGDGLHSVLPKDEDVPSSVVVSGGLTAGIDYRFSPQWTFGLGLGYAQSYGETGTDELKIDGKNFTPGIYGTFNGDSYYVDGLLAIQNSTYNSKRKVVYGTQTKIAEATPSGRAYGVGLEAGLPIQRGAWGIVPMGGVQMSRETVKAFDETGAGAVSLSVGEEKRNGLASYVGVRLLQQLSEDSRDRIEIRSAWRHEFAGQTTIDASFVGTGNSFSVTGSDPQKDSAMIGGDLGAGLMEDLSVIFSYDGDFGEIITNRIHGSIQYRF